VVKLPLGSHAAATAAAWLGLTWRPGRRRSGGMFYRPDQPDAPRAGLLNALVLPRPIGWISSIDAEGRANLAPYSFFNAVACRPPQVMFAATGAHEQGGLKDSLATIQATGEFVVNLATWSLRPAVNASSLGAPPGFDEFAHAGLAKLPSVTVRPPRVAESPVQLECVLSQLVELKSPSPEQPNRMVIGRVTGVHIADSVLVDGRVDPVRLDAIARLGYDQYARMGEVFAMTRPRWPVDGD
jgi:flavin reductase (DIM6/NTAB) family NADH-FMN oxidoreductase RutF